MFCMYVIKKIVWGHQWRYCGIPRQLCPIEESANTWIDYYWALFMLRIWWLVKASNEIFLTTHLIISCYTYNPYMTTYLTWKKGDRLICLILKKGAYIFERWRFSLVLEIPRHAKYKVTNRPFLYVSVVSTPQIGKFVTVYLKYEEEKH